MKRIIKKLIATGAIVTLVFICGLISIVFSPYALFANQMDYKKFSIHSSEELKVKDFQYTLDQAYELIQLSELHDSEYNFKILFAHRHFFNKIESLQGEGVIARATAGYITIKVAVEPETNIVYGHRRKLKLSYLLAHEMIHVLQTNKLGMLNMNPLNHPPLWKLEGYPEYIARRDELNSSDYNFTGEVDRYIKLNNESKDGMVEVRKDHFMPFYYYKGRLMIEYLIGVKGMTYDEILNDNRTEEEVFDELLMYLSHL